MAKSLVFIFLLGVTVYGAEQKSISNGKSKRSDILVYDLVQQMVAEQIERKKILKEFRVMKNELRDVKRELKERNTMMQDTKFLQKKLFREINHIKEKAKQASIAEVKKGIDSFEHRIVSLTKKLWNKMKLHDQLIKAGMRDTKREIGSLKNKTSKEFQLIHQDIIDLLNKTDDFGKKVAFSANLQAKTTTSSTIVFNNVITNIGGGYNNKDGIFRCPISGLYLISFTLTSTRRENVVGYLMKNDKSMARVHENVKLSAYPSAALTVVLPLFKGDNVWIKGYNGITYYNPDCAFACVLIKS